jgi:hypothetical protein
MQKLSNLQKDKMNGERFKTDTENNENGWRITDGSDSRKNI